MPSIVSASDPHVGALAECHQVICFSSQPCQRLIRVIDGDVEHIGNVADEVREALHDLRGTLIGGAVCFVKEVIDEAGDGEHATVGRKEGHDIGRTQVQEGLAGKQGIEQDVEGVLPPLRCSYPPRRFRAYGMSPEGQARTP